MFETKTCYGCGKDLDYPRYYCKTGGALYNYQCLKVSLIPEAST
jgi:hypothetical protein